MILKEEKGIRWLEFEQLQEQKGLFHAIYLRDLNFRDPQVDPSISEQWGVKKMARLGIVHGTEVGIFPQHSLDGCDGVITKEQNVGLIATHADCQIALFYDPMEQVMGTIHCGWRGNVANIYAKAVAKLKGAFGVKPENLLVCISPSLGPNASEFLHYKREFPPHFWSYQVKPYYFDLWAIAKDQLVDAGVLPSHIEMANVCTYENETDFFSHRRDKKTGRHGTVIGRSAKC